MMYYVPSIYVSLKLLYTYETVCLCKASVSDSDRVRVRHASASDASVRNRVVCVVAEIGVLDLRNARRGGKPKARRSWAWNGVWKRPVVALVGALLHSYEGATRNRSSGSDR